MDDHDLARANSPVAADVVEERIAGYARRWMMDDHDLDRRARGRFASAPTARANSPVAADVVEELALRTEELEANARDIREAIREAALASEDGEGGWLWALIDVENAEKSYALLDAASQVRREVRLEQAAAKAVADELRAQLEEARERIAGYDRQLTELEERIVRPVCARLGQGDTRVVKTGLTRVAIHRKPARVEIVDEDVIPLLPDDLRRVKYEPLKAAIKAAIEAGASFPGIELHHDTRVDWK